MKSHIKAVVKTQKIMSPTILYTLVAGFCLWLLVDSTSSKRVRITQGNSGDVCEGGVRKCVRRRASCINDTCMCDVRGSGSGDFACFTPGTYHSEIVSDPRLRTFARDSVPLPVTCRYLFSHFRTRFSGLRNSTCEITIHAFNRKHLGKVFLHGFDVALRVSPGVPMGFSARQYGTAFEGKYTFRQSESMQFRPDGPWDMFDPPVTLYLPGTVVSTRHDPYNNFGYIEVENCGFSIRFRPFDTLYGKNQLQVPGLALAVNSLHNPEWLSKDRVMALVPTGEPSLGTISASVGLEPEHAMLLRLAQAGVLQNQPDVTPECTAWADVVTSCTDVARRKLAFETCTFTVTIARIIKCFDSFDNGNAMMSLFKRCFQSICFQEPVNCRQIQAELAICPNTQGLPEVDAFLEPSTCQFA